MSRTRIGVLVSGKGSNLVALAEAAQEPGFPGEIALVLCNRRDAGAVDVASRFGVPCTVLPLSDFNGDTVLRDADMVTRLRQAGVTLVVCAGYNRVLGDEFLAAFPGAIINVHPSLLPAFGGGMDAVEQALAAGVKVSGCTVHLLAPGDTDSGPIILQAAVPVEDGDSADDLRQRIHEQEWRLVPQAVSLWCEGRLRISADHVAIVEPGVARA